MSGAAGPAARGYLLGPWVVLMASLHVLVDLRLDSGMVRVGLADLLLPALLGAVLWQSRKLFPALLRCLRDTSAFFWLAIATVWLLVSLIVGRVAIGHWQGWALVNKGIGWLMLMAYFVTGFLLAHGRYIPVGRLVQSFVVTAWLIGWYFLLTYVPFKLGITQGVDYIRLKGLFANPNAYGYAMVVVLVLQIPYMKRRAWNGEWLHAFGAAVLLYNIFLSGSRSALVGLALAIPLLLYLRMIDWKMAGRVLLVSGVIAVGCFWLPLNLIGLGSPVASVAIAREAEGRPVYLLRAKGEMNSGVSIRLRLTRRAVALWRSSPLLGIGLGGFLWDQQNARQERPLVIHNTALWLLTETGVIGLLIFLALFLAMWRQFWRTARQAPEQPLYVGLLAMMLVMAGASLGMEAMYQRHLWLFAGLGLGLLCGRSEEEMETMSLQRP